MVGGTSSHGRMVVVKVKEGCGVDVDDNVLAIHFLTARFQFSSMPFFILSLVCSSNHTSFKTKRTSSSNPSGMAVFAKHDAREFERSRSRAHRNARRGLE